MTSRIATVPSENKAYRTVRRSLCALDEASYHLDSASAPWSVHLEVRVTGGVVEDRLRHAVGVALARHPRARARLSTGRSDRVEWEIISEPDVDALNVVVCSDDDALRAARAELQSLTVPLVVSPPLRIRLARHRDGDVVMLNVHHAAGDGIAALCLLRSIARAYAGRPDLVAQTPPEQVQIPAPSGGRWGQIQALVRELRQAAPRSAHLVPIGGADRPGYQLHHLVLDTAQTAALAAKAKAGTTPAAAVRFLGVLQHLPLPAKQGIARLAASERVIPTAILSNLGRLDDDLDFGPELRASEVWFSPPARMPMGLAVGALTAVGRLHLVLRYRHPLFGPAEIAGFGDSYRAALGHLAAGTHVGSFR